MPITTQHADYMKYAPRWRRMELALDEQDTIHAKGEEFLPKTTGMADVDASDNLYLSYKGRARFYGIVRQTLTGMIGLMFEKDPEGATDEPITKSGQTNVQLARDVARDVSAYGRSILVVDAPEKGKSGKPFVVKYNPLCLVNWKVDPNNEGRFLLAVLEEEWPDPGASDEYSHATVTRYRVYRMIDGKVTVTVYDEKENVVPGYETRPIVGPKQIPVYAIGSISVDPGCDPVPLLPVVDCAVSIYQISADLRQDLYMSGQKQLWMSGMSEDQYNNNVTSGYGAGSTWFLGNNDGKAGLLESTGNAYDSMSSERQHEMEQAQSYAVKMTQTSDRAESGAALKIKASAQHATIYTMADSVSIGINQVMLALKQWAGDSKAVETFAIRTEFTNEEAGAQMIAALDNAINSGNMVRDVMWEVVRRAGYSENTNEEFEEILSNSGIGSLGPARAPAVVVEKDDEVPEGVEE